MKGNSWHRAGVAAPARRTLPRLGLSCALALSGCSVSATPTALSNGEGSVPPPSRSLIRSTPRFALHSNQAVNLHHFLYQWARGQVSDRRRPVDVPERERLARLSPADRAMWQKSVEYYAGKVVDRDLLFDRTLTEVKTRLAAAASVNDRRLDGLPPELLAALRSASPIYARHWWPAHDRQNRRWTADVGGKLEQFGPRLADALARAFGGGWPEAPIRVDVTAYANWAGAYTSRDPVHITVSSTDPDLQDYAALEILFHEASHSAGHIGSLMPELAAAFESAETGTPRDLWHAFIFYTTGQLVQRTLALEGIADYEPYAERTGMYQRVPGWLDYRKVLEAYWKPYLDEAVSRSEALASIAADLEP